MSLFLSIIKTLHYNPYIVYIDFGTLVVFVVPRSFHMMIKHWLLSNKHMLWALSPAVGRNCTKPGIPLGQVFSDPTPAPLMNYKLHEQLESSMTHDMAREHSKILFSQKKKTKNTHLPLHQHNLPELKY